MAADNVGRDDTVLAIDDAFTVLGNETRIRILQVLSEATEPISFSELRQRVGTRDSGQFNYHLGKLEGHFVRGTADGYELGQAGRFVVQAVFSGIVTDDTSIDRIKIDYSCNYCEAPIEMQVRSGNVDIYCSKCPGSHEESRSGHAHASTVQDSLGHKPLPPAGFQHRTPEEVYRAAKVWENLEILSVANGVCPRCSAALDRSVDVCREHDAADGRCDACDRRDAVSLHTSCTNCIYEATGAIQPLLDGHTDVRAFQMAHGIDPLVPSPEAESGVRYEEELLSVDPIEVRVTYTCEGDTLVLTVDDGSNVTAISRDYAVDAV